MRTPAGEVEIDVALIERLVAAQFPELAASVKIVANGWDNVVARLGPAHVVRMPRRAAAVPLVENEARWLPGLAPMLPVPIPAPIAVGAPDAGYPWPWTITPWTPGVPATELSPEQRLPLAADLGAVHIALHVPAPPDAPDNPVRGVPLADRAEAFATRLAGLPTASAGVLGTTFEDALAAPVFGGSPVWLHGDPHPGNLLATSSGDTHLAALLDFGDICRGDPATDLAVAWTVFDAEGRELYRAAMHPDAALWRRARGWAAIMASALLESSDDHPVHAAIGAHTVEQLAAEL